jgi:transcriptional regulator with XRE-family HTH domain
MARPTTRAKSEVSVALTRLRQSLGETQHAFALRTGTTPVTIARYESSRPPQGEALERLYALATKHRHTESARVFQRALEREKQHMWNRQRIAKIADPLNLGQANRLLQSLWMSAAWLAIGQSKEQMQLAGEHIRRDLLELADLISLGGRKDLMGDD